MALGIGLGTGSGMGEGSTSTVANTIESVSSPTAYAGTKITEKKIEITTNWNLIFIYSSIFYRY